MSYIALYRKWRPDSFDEVKGQDAIVRTLRNQIIYDRIGHAYLFCGTRGTGKTSIAKLFARAVNCEHPDRGNPCGHCAVCKSMLSHSSLDILEIDAASNNGVDHIREIREQVQYPPASGRYKVYIIDEVHMLSSGAFNALLKTLEEPPSYVIFILATTEKHKIPMTILSRCQRYDFKRIPTKTIAAHLADLMEREHISAEEKALTYIARAGDGSMRDALSLLDQCISFYLGETLTYDKVLNVLGTVDQTVFSRILTGVLTENVSEVLQEIDQVINQGRELNQFLTDFLWYLRNLLLLKENIPAAGLDLSEDTLAALREDASRAEAEDLLRCIRVLSELSARLRTASGKRVLLEIGFIRLTKPQTETDTDSLLARIKRLEERADQGAILAPASSLQRRETHEPLREETAEETPDPLELLADRFAPAEVQDLKEIAASWQQLVQACPMPMQRFLREARPMVSENSRVILLCFESEGMAKAYFEKNDRQNLTVLTEMISARTKKQVSLACICRNNNRLSGGNYIDLSKIHHPIIYE